MKKMLAVVAAVGLLLVAAAPADARERQGGGGHRPGVRSGPGHGSHGHHFQGNRLHGHGHRFQGHGHRFHGHHGHGHHRFHGHGFRSSVVIGTGVWFGPYWGPYWYPPYYPAYAPVVTEPQTYIEQSPPPSYWYYCEAAKAYHPYVQQCPGGWLTVVPHAAPESER